MKNEKVNDDFLLSEISENPRSSPSNEEEVKEKKEQEENIIEKDKKKEIVDAPTPTPTHIEKNSLDSSVLKKIKKKRGNYIFTIGYTSSGKSVIQNMFIYRVATRSDMEFYLEKKTDDFGHDAFINNWIENITQGILPERSANRPKELTISFTPYNNKKLELSMIDLSGERIQTVIPNEKNTEPTLGPEMDEYLKSNKIKKQFIFVSDPTRNTKFRVKHPDKRISKYKSEDTLFNSLLEYLRRKNRWYNRKLNILFIITKWDLIKDEYPTPSDYLSENFPRTFSNMQLNKKINVQYIHFSAGKIDEERQILLEKDNDSVDSVIEKIYNAFPTTYDRIIKWML